MSLIEYVAHPDITSRQWDQCIKTSFNGSIEAYSWYLNLFCDRWDALIEGDYETVMPLPVRKRLGHTQVYMPPFIRQLGIFSPQQLSVSRVTDFLTLLKNKFRVVTMGINKYTPVPEGIFSTGHETFFELDLIRPYVRTAREYTPECRVRIQMASSKRYSVMGGIAPNDIITFLKRERIRTERAVMANDFKMLRMLIASLVRYKAGEIYGVYDNVNMLNCVAVFAWSGSSAILLFAAATPKAVADNAHILLYDRFIAKYSETNITMNFEYMDVHHTPKLYGGFGATRSLFQQVCMNRLPFPVRSFFR